MPQTLDDRIVKEKADPNRRDSLRLPQPEGHGFAQLRVGSRTVVVEVLDESAGGFMVSGDKVPTHKPAVPVELTHRSGKHVLRVVWRREVDGTTRLGLERLPDHITWRRDSSWIIWVLAAIIIGFGGGYVAAFRDQDELVQRIVDLSLSQRTVENSHAATPSPEK